MPTAQQSDEIGHVTLYNKLNPSWVLSLGESTSIHAVPSQCSVRVNSTPLLISIPPPTAQQSAADVHVTPYRAEFARVLLRSGEVTMVQEIPSQCSMRGWTVALLEPTAQQADVDTHVTP